MEFPETIIFILPINKIPSRLFSIIFLEILLDLTNLKMERRREALLFWKDTLELQRELHQLKEQFAIESKVAELFKGLRDDAVQD